MDSTQIIQQFSQLVWSRDRLAPERGLDRRAYQTYSVGEIFSI